VQALALVRAQPGITIPELAKRMGIKQNYLYRVLPGLQSEGRVRKQGRGWHPKG
jgi:DNA-binding IclR family transcriptional regulator